MLSWVHRRHAGTPHRRRAPPVYVVSQPAGGAPLPRRPTATFLLHPIVAVLVLLILLVLLVLLLGSQRAKEEQRQEEVSLQFPGCLHGEQPGGDGHVSRHLLRVLHCHHCPVK